MVYAVGASTLVPIAGVVVAGVSLLFSIGQFARSRRKDAEDETVGHRAQTLAELEAIIDYQQRAIGWLQASESECQRSLSVQRQALEAHQREISVLRAEVRRLRPGGIP